MNKNKKTINKIKIVILRIMSKKIKVNRRKIARTMARIRAQILAQIRAQIMTMVVVVLMIVQIKPNLTRIPKIQKSIRITIKIKTLNRRRKKTTKIHKTIIAIPNNKRTKTPMTIH